MVINPLLSHFDRPETGTHSDILTGQTFFYHLDTFEMDRPTAQQITRTDTLGYLRIQDRSSSTRSGRSATLTDRQTDRQTNSQTDIFYDALSVAPSTCSQILIEDSKETERQKDCDNRQTSKVRQSTVR